MRVVSQEEMGIIEQIVMEKMKFDGPLITENVGISGASLLEEYVLDQHDIDEIIILVGRGNNGSDALAVGRQLCNRGHSVRAILLYSGDDMGGEVKRQLDLAYDFGAKVTEIKKADELESFFATTQGKNLIIDGIIGGGLRLPLPNQLFDIVNVINKYASIIVSIDIPTGICSDTGSSSGNAIQADITLVVALPKTGHFIGDGATHSGALLLADAGFPLSVTEGGDKFLLDITSLSDFYEKRSVYGHKKTFGHCLVVGGSNGMTGAVMLSAGAALGVGTGLVTASTWEENYPELCSRIQAEVITGLIPTVKGDIDEISKELSRWDTVVIGPGLGRSPKAREVVLQVLNHFAGPVVVDADALRVLDMDKDAELLSQRKGVTVLTPHIGEFADFAKADKKKVLENPLSYLRTLIDKTNCCILLKGAASYLGLPNGETYINYFPNDGMATAGSGDVLSGILGGVLAQVPNDDSSSLFANKNSYFDALKLGLLVHTLAGEKATAAVGSRSVSSGLIIDSISGAFDEIDNFFFDDESETGY
jgi:NAD(P)H-hydrate epimerase